MDVSIVGAAGTIGRAVAVRLVQEGLLGPGARLQLVGRRGGDSERLLHGLAADLADAHAETLPALDLAFSPEEILGDVILVAAGATVGPGGARDRRELMARNAPLLDEIGAAIARRGSGGELVLVLTNPVEVAVEVMCRHLPRRRVIGLGAYLDTLRFRHEIALDLGVPRPRVLGLVLGEHGVGMVPCWSTVAVMGLAESEGAARLAPLRRRRDPAPAQAVGELVKVLTDHGPEAAYRHLDRWGPGLRTLARPYVTQMSGARTPLATAEMTVRLMATLLSGDLVATAAQLRLEGEWLGITGVIGAPAVLSLRGVEQVGGTPLAPDEEQAVRACAATVAGVAAEGLAALPGKGRA